jgi:tryptophan 2,3-dioxygenase
MTHIGKRAGTGGTPGLNYLQERRPKQILWSDLYILKK